MLKEKELQEKIQRLENYINKLEKATENALWAIATENCNLARAKEIYAEFRRELSEK